MPNPNLLFQDDECLRNDPDYKGIYVWWRETFNRSFEEDWKSVKGTEQDYGDTFVRSITIDSVIYKVTYSFDGYSVERQ